MLEFLKSIFKIRQLSLNSLRNIFDFKKQVETMEGKKWRKHRQYLFLQTWKKTLPNERYKMDFSKSLLTYPPELLGRTVGLPICYYMWHYYLLSPFWAFISNTAVVLLLRHVNIIGMMVYSSVQTSSYQHILMYS